MEERAHRRLANLASQVEPINTAKASGLEVQLTSGTTGDQSVCASREALRAGALEGAQVCRPPVMVLKGVLTGTHPHVCA